MKESAIVKATTVGLKAALVSGAIGLIVSFISFLALLTFEWVRESQLPS